MSRIRVRTGEVIPGLGRHAHVSGDDTRLRPGPGPGPGPCDGTSPVMVVVGAVVDAGSVGRGRGGLSCAWHAGVGVDVDVGVLGRMGVVGFVWVALGFWVSLGVA